MSDPTKINGNGWLQGAILPDELRDAVLEERAVGRDRAVVVVLTQDCDLVHSSYDAEPHAELITGTVVAVADNGLRHGRNPRRLHVEAQRDGSPVVLAFSIHDRLLVPRPLLEDHAPHPSLVLGLAERRMLCEWVAKRYVRAAFPDAFNERLRAAHRKIDKALKRGGEHVTGLFLMIDPDEEQPVDRDYRLFLRVVTTTEALTSAEREVELVRLAKIIADALASCDGIVVEDHELLSESEFTLADLRFFKRWDWDYRSHSGDPGGDLAP